MAKTKAISGLAKIIANLGLDYLDPRLAEILKDGSFLEKTAAAAIESLRESVDVISDDDDRNAEQLTVVWLKFVNEKLIAILRETLQPVIDSVEKEEDRDLLNFAANAAFSIVGLLTDSVAQNKEQLSVFFAELGKADDTRNVILGKAIAVANTFVKDKALVALFKSVLNAIFDLVQGKELSKESSKQLGYA